MEALKEREDDGEKDREKRQEQKSDLGVFVEWDIEDKISTFTAVFPGTEVDEVFEAVGDVIQWKKKLLLNGQFFRVYCCADLFRSMMQDAFDKIRWTMEDIRLIAPWPKSEPFWHIFLRNLNGAIELESQGEYSNTENYDGYDIPSAEEWKKVRGVCKLVGSIYKIAAVLYEGKNSTANVYFHLLRELQAVLTEESTSSDEFTQSLAKEMLEKFKVYWKDMFIVLAVVAVLDPRFKMKYIEFSCSKYDNHDEKSQAKMVLEAIRSLYDDYAAHTPSTEYPGNELSSDSEEYSHDTESEEESSRVVEERCINHYEDFNLFKEYCQLQVSYPLKSDLDLYLEEPVLAGNQNFNALSWWKAASSRYPILSKMARDFLAIPVSVVTSYDAYYLEPREPGRRGVTSLKNDHMNAWMCTQSWLKGQQKSR